MVAMTDHENVIGIENAVNSLQLILSAEYQGNYWEIHISFPQILLSWYRKFGDEMINSCRQSYVVFFNLEHITCGPT